jgi:hypothetical protein
MKTMTTIDMKTPAKKPCGECPFLKTSIPGWLGPWTAQELVTSLAYEPFPCHQTIPESAPTDFVGYKACAGMAVFLNNKFECSRDAGNRMAQNAMKNCDKEVKNSVFKNTKEFIDYHTDGLV